MRLTWSIAAVIAVGLWLGPAAMVSAQDQVLMPDQSTAKAKQIIQQAIDALGGQTYLNIHDVTCTGHAGMFGHSGDLNGFENFIDYTIPPSKDVQPKDRQENLPKRNLIEIYNGDKGWVLDRGGVSEAAVSDVNRYQEDMKIDLYNILRNRIHEPNMIFRYAGADVVDLHEVDWVELVDSENRTIRIAFNRSTHLPVRKTVDTRNPTSQLKSQEVEIYSNYHPIEGIQTPFQITRDRNELRDYQVFFDKCQYNTNVSDSLFTKESLDERWSKIGKKEKYKGSKDKKNIKSDSGSDKD